MGLAAIECQGPQVENGCCAAESRHPAFALMEYLWATVARGQHRVEKTDQSQKS